MESASVDDERIDRLVTLKNIFTDFFILSLCSNYNVLRLKDRFWTVINQMDVIFWTTSIKASVLKLQLNVY